MQTDVITSPEVAAALAAGRPVVALESTIITHGMPYPQNVETARAVEATVRENGAVPATIAVLNGKLVAGLDEATLDRLGQAKDVFKATRRDLAPIMVRGGTAGTTVAATMVIAAKAGIPVFATGGVGGVHRGAEETFDISADLIELSQTPVTVVCAGAKSILDIPKTLEFLETHGVPVLGYRSTAFPAFFTRESGETVDFACDSPEEIASVIATHRALGFSSGLLIANPIPEADALDSAMIDQRIAEAIAEAEAKGVTRKALTPFLLQRILELTDGRSLVANIALVKNNAALAARIAVALAGSNG
ncbi:Pseudouridine-5'-phosphate glycosidase [Hartmannibacter diazotrophicus]|uniref:Pseudouridine-5'-phosphate glycosidase n=1 Tax=Hartmannibacter diazotrophicus TaxID=1482074 RepID=A0A2C9DCK4_9HYPH|nr:pseudouridine-5'-phosphate glycosidase [Hartmannibacter diazotrophicus]SON57461.1 Pseudouridine-5'-phosphate glycosidase [Hartmannibacter diazotrophicus]